MLMRTMGQTKSRNVDASNMTRTVGMEPAATVQTTDSGMGRPVSGWWRYG